MTLFDQSIDVLNSVFNKTAKFYMITSRILREFSLTVALAPKSKLEDMAN